MSSHVQPCPANLSPVSLITMYCNLRAGWTGTNRLDDFYMTCIYFTNDKLDDQMNIKRVCRADSGEGEEYL